MPPRRQKSPGRVLRGRKTTTEEAEVVEAEIRTPRSATRSKTPTTLRRRSSSRRASSRNLSVEPVSIEIDSSPVKASDISKRKKTAKSTVDETSSMTYGDHDNQVDRRNDDDLMVSATANESPKGSVNSY